MGFLWIMLPGIAVLVAVMVMVQKGKLGTWGAVGASMMVTWVCGLVGFVAIAMACWDWISYIFTPK